MNLTLHNFANISSSLNSNFLFFSRKPMPWKLLFTSMTYLCSTFLTGPRASHTQLKNGTNLRGDTTSGHGQKQSSKMAFLSLEVFPPAKLSHKLFRVKM